MLMVRDKIIATLKDCVQELGIKDLEPQLAHPQEPSHGDYSSNIALVAAKNLKQTPLELAEKIKKLLEIRDRSLDVLDRIEVAKPGFINFWLSKKYLVSSMVQIIEPKNQYDSGKAFAGKKILVEFAHPNTHKEFHIGHLRNITLGEAICRLLESSGAKVRRVNYQGDVGLHVAKAIFGLRQLGEKTKQAKELSLSARARLLGEAYALGSKRYEEDEKARDEIGEINKQIYRHEPTVTPLWEETRKWSLEYFDSLYGRLGTKFDRLYFESEVYEPGKKVVLSHIDDSIFTKDQGAIIFNGERYDLHKRVFITKEGNPTYEGKEMGLGPLQYKEFPFDLAIHVVGPEQAGYFAVTFKALELVNPRLVGKERHLSYGLIQLKEGKMSSRMGNVVSGEWLLEETKKFLRQAFPKMPDETLEQVAIGAVKYSMLKVSLSQNITFSFEESISLEGNSGPYLQYTYARTQSVLGKVSASAQKLDSLKRRGLLRRDYLSKLENEEIVLLRIFHRFPEVVEEAAVNFAPNLICNYLFDLAQTFNLFYQKHKIIGSDSEDFRLGLTEGVGLVLQRGLALLGIEAPGRM